jgi:glycosyltransferase involved in cell wall biosynthesis
MSRKRVLFLLQELRRGGAEIQLIDLINGLDPKLFSKHLLCFDRTMELKDRLDQREVEMFHRIRKGRLDFSVIREISRIIDRRSIDIVHCTLMYACLMGWLAVRLSRRKPKLVAALHTTSNRCRKDDLKDALVYQWILRSFSRVIFVCQGQMEHWQKKYPFFRRNGVVVHNGIDQGYFSPATISLGDREIFLRELSIPERSFVIACIAGFRPEKGHDVLLKAFSLLPKSAYLLLAGEGSMRRSMEALAERKGVSARVRFLGSVADVRKVLSIADVTVLASRAVETFSLAMLESMAMGRPVVSTDIGGSREAVIPGQTGVLVRPDDPVTLAKELEQLMGDKTLRFRLGENARKIVEQRFTRLGMVEKTGRVLLSV